MDVGYLHWEEGQTLSMSYSHREPKRMSLKVGKEEDRGSVPNGRRWLTVVISLSK